MQSLINTINSLNKITELNNDFLEKNKNEFIFYVNESFIYEEKENFVLNYVLTYGNEYVKKHVIENWFILNDEITNSQWENILSISVFQDNNELKQKIKKVLPLVSKEKRSGIATLFGNQPYRCGLSKVFETSNSEDKIKTSVDYVLSLLKDLDPKFNSKTLFSGILNHLTYHKRKESFKYVVDKFKDEQFRKNFFTAEYFRELVSSLTKKQTEVFIEVLNDPALEVDFINSNNWFGQIDLELCDVNVEGIKYLNRKITKNNIDKINIIDFISSSINIKDNDFCNEILSWEPIFSLEELLDLKVFDFDCFFPSKESDIGFEKTTELLNMISNSNIIKDEDKASLLSTTFISLGKENAVNAEKFMDYLLKLPKIKNNIFNDFLEKVEKRQTSFKFITDELLAKAHLALSLKEPKNKLKIKI